MCNTRRGIVTLVVLCWITVLCNGEHKTEETFPAEFDFRRISYEELVAEAPVFSDENIVGYTQLTLDPDYDQLLVGARDRLFRLSLDDLNLLEETDISAPFDVADLCRKKGQPESYCYNYVRVMLLHNYTKTNSNSNVEHAVFICGTNAFTPSCTWRPADNLTVVLETEKGIGKVPYNPDHNSTAIITDDGNFYGATMIGPGDRDPAIYRSQGLKSNELRTIQSNSKWLNQPDFISAYEIGDFVYFFFREVAVEYINCGKRIYSRVARLCKTDEGITYDKSWTTYYKARLNCSLPGEYPFYYDELQSTYLLETGAEKYLYAVFTTPSNSIAGSAVCVYNMTAFNDSFTGPYKYQSDARAAWEKHDNPRPLTQCPVKRDTSKRSNEETMKNSMIELKYQLMDNAVQPVTMTPLLYSNQERWSHVVVDNVKAKNGVYKVVFVATEDGKILKKTQLLNSNTTCLIEEIKIVPNGEHKPVKGMKISSENMALYISTRHNIIKVPVHRCSRFTNSDLCINSNDPYCGWDDAVNRCTIAPSGQPEVHYWKQSMTSCPFIQHPVDGDWSAWTDWDMCNQVGGDPTAGNCQCRMRACDHPRPYYGGRPCIGASVEVTNCTTHGQWTEWTAWSSCSQSCGSTATHRRYRLCSNPPPRFGGRNCMGPDSEEDYCIGHPPCPLPPVQSNWTEWSDWSQCSAHCNGGVQSRRRMCNEPLPPVQSMPCIGETKQWTTCNNHICDVLNMMTPWTPWVAVNQTKGGAFEQRFRFLCSAQVPSQDSFVRATSLKPQTRFCIDGECHSSGELRNEIDTHSAVDRILRRYCKHRRRIFRNYCKCRTLGIFLVCQKCGYG